MNWARQSLQCFCDVLSNAFRHHLEKCGRPQSVAEVTYLLRL